MFPNSRIVRVAAVTAFGATSLAGLAVAGALPGMSQGSPPVSTPDPNPAAGDHPDLGAANAGTHTADVPAPTDVTEPTESTTTDGSRSDGLTTAADNVTNPTASAVIEQLLATAPGPDTGADVSAVASGGAAPETAPTAPPLPDAGQGGLSHRP